MNRKRGSKGATNTSVLAATVRTSSSPHSGSSMSRGLLPPSSHVLLFKRGPQNEKLPLSVGVSLVHFVQAPIQSRNLALEQSRCQRTFQLRMHVSEHAHQRNGLRTFCVAVSKPFSSENSVLVRCTA